MNSTKLFTALFIPVLLLIFINSNQPAVAQGSSGDTELGVLLGEPTGISVQVWQSRTNAIDGAVAWSFEGEDNLHIHADYLFYRPLEAEYGVFSFFYGFGARALLADDPRFGGRFPIGLHYQFPEERISLFLEVAPIMDLVPATEFTMNGGIGVRVRL
jgi:hypothetical protein